MTSKIAVFLLFGLMSHMAAGQGDIIDDCHDPIVPHVGLEPLLAADACLIESALTLSPPDYVTVAILYEEGQNNKEVTLKSIATAEYETDIYQRFASIFEDASWIDTRLTAAIQGVEPYTTDTRRTQVINKLVQGSILVQRALWHLDKAVTKYEAGNSGSAVVDWDRAMAAYYGVDTSCAPFGTAQSRGIEFGTISEGVSDTNRAIHDQFFQGFATLTRRNDSLMIPEARLEIIRQLQIIYIQSVFKYATLTDEGLQNGEDVEKFMAEGYAYYAAIYPFIAEVDFEGAEQILAAFDLTTDPDLGIIQEVKPILTRNFESLDITPEEIKEFDGTARDNYVEPDVLSCVIENPFGGVGTRGDIDR